VGGIQLPDAFYDGNHVVASKTDKPWEIQKNIGRAYRAFYNPINLIKAVFTHRDECRAERIQTQLFGMIGYPWTHFRYHQWIRALKKGPIVRWNELPELPHALMHVGDSPHPGGILKLAKKLIDNLKPHIFEAT
jgi:hypothetical protein